MYLYKKRTQLSSAGDPGFPRGDRQLQKDGHQPIIQKGTSKILLCRSATDHVCVFYRFTNLLCYRPQRSWAKVIFLHVSVILLTGVGGGRWWGGFLFFSISFPPKKFLLGCTTPPPPRRSMRGRYASYWNAFLFLHVTIFKLRQIVYHKNCT